MTDTHQSTQIQQLVNPDIHCITADLYSNDTQKQRQVLRQHFSPNASFVSPLLRTSGIKNIGHVFLVWKTLNRDPPTIEKSCSNQHHCVIFMTQHLRPRLFPLLHLALPVIVTLKFRESESGKLKVEHLEEHWTVEGLLQTVPLIAFWHDRVLRTAMGKILTVTGHAMHTVIVTSQKMSQRSIELEGDRRVLVDQNMVNQQSAIIMSECNE